MPARPQPTAQQFAVLQRMAAHQGTLHGLAGGFWVSGPVATNQLGIPVVPHGKTCADVWCDGYTVRELEAAGWIVDAPHATTTIRILTEAAKALLAKAA